MSAFLGLLMHFLVFKPLRNSPTLGKVIGSIGVFPLSKLHDCREFWRPE